MLGKQTRNLSRRAHRFDSYQKPLARFCLFTAAFFETATWISVHKKSDLKPFTAATDFLTCVTAEKLLLLAMCADGADESLMLTRHFDSESHDIAEIHAAADSYVTRLKFLFCSGASSQNNRIYISHAPMAAENQSFQGWKESEVHWWSWHCDETDD